MAKATPKQTVESVYKIVELVGSSPTSWEEATRNAIETAGSRLRDLRIADVVKLDARIEGGKITFRARVSLSFKYDQGSQ
ncbi:MAG: dodecin family protein [Burkholderiales bacterium]|nr:dodecin domain-containing protein [Burkholderiales bacterium]MDQ3195816.1 dodecin family protein [Pseudomonadota bacterium]